MRSHRLAAAVAGRVPRDRPGPGLGPGFCAGIRNGLLLGFLMYASGLLPRRVAAFGVVAGSLAFVAATGALLGVYARQSGSQPILTVPEMIWELTFGVWLVVKGFAPVAVRNENSERRTGKFRSSARLRASARWCCRRCADADSVVARALSGSALVVSDATWIRHQCRQVVPPD